MRQEAPPAPNGFPQSGSRQDTALTGRSGPVEIKLGPTHDRETDPPLHDFGKARRRVHGRRLQSRGPRLKHLVAIKLLPPQIAASDDGRTRFKIEAQAAAALNHTNIAGRHGSPGAGS